MFQNFSVDRLSFWIGFVGGIFFAWFFARLRQLLPEIRKNLRARVRSTQESMSAGVDLRFRSDVLRLALNQHLASPLFSLEEVFIEPKLIAPPIQPQHEREDAAPDLYSQVIPYLPDWPEMAGAFGAPHLTLAETLQKGANLLVLGNPGAGKTVALAHLALLAARRSAELGELSQHLPVYLHAADLPLQQGEGKDLLSNLLEGVSENVSPLTLPRLGKLLRDEFEAERILLILDGLDELPPAEVDRAAQYLQALLKKYPKIRLVAAASPEYYGSLPALGLVPVAVGAWNVAQRAEFLQRWSDIWERYISRQNPDADEIDSLLLNSWLKDPDLFASPLETTLKIWAAYAGDALGPGPFEAVEAYLLRMMAKSPQAREMLEKTAAENARQMRAVFSAKEAEQFASAALAAVEPAADLTETDPEPETGVEKTDSKKKEGKSKTSQPQLDVQRILNDLKNAGLLVSRKGSRFSFVHPLLSAYLGGIHLATCGNWEELLTQPHWTGKTLTLRFTALFADLSANISYLLEQDKDPSYRGTLNVLQWLRDIPKPVRWRALAMRRTTQLVQDDTLPMGVRARGIAALASTKDPGTTVLFRQFMRHTSYNLRLLGCLGCGLMRDAKAVPDLVKRLDDFHPTVSKAALLALGVIANRPSLEAIADTLLHSDEEMRRTAAEVLANLPDEGHPALVDGSRMEDLLVRRAVVYGLARIRQPWAIQILEKMQIEDGQWVVRAAAAQALEEINRGQAHIPEPLPQLTETPWLILFAGKQGMGVTPGKVAFDLVIQALRQGDEKEKLAALEYLTLYGDGSSAPAVYQALYGSEGSLQEAAYHTIWCMSGKGAELPSPVQFGLG